MNRLRALARLWLKNARPAIVVRIARHQGSTPRETGTRMLVATDDLAGTIGGGRLEFEAVALARQALAGGAGAPLAPAAPFERRYALGPSLGQCCGGAVVLEFAPLTDGLLGQWPDAPPLFHLQLYGAGHVGRELVHLLSRHPCDIDWIDERADHFPAVAAPDDSPARIRQVAVDLVQAEVGLAPPGACYLVMTHSHDLDLLICDAVLRRGDCGFLGLIGSASKRARFRSRLAARGLPEAALARLTCPIGQPGIRSKRPEAIALAVAAQLLSRVPPDRQFDTESLPAQPTGELMQN